MQDFYPELENKILSEDQTVTFSTPSAFHNGLATTLPPDEVIFGRGAAMWEIRQKLPKVANANVPILIEGESGTGKEIIAKLLHRSSPWNTGPFVKVNCSSIPGTLMESELFGYEKGAFTGAYGTKAGRVELANRGTLLLDEIGELEMDLQAKLLQVLQDGQFCRIGGEEDRRVDARMVCATNRQLEKEIAAGRFREDLFYRINVVNISLPPLRERKEDIPILVRYFIERYNQSYNRRAQNPSAGLLRRFQEYHWPGNIRQLENLSKRYVIFESEESVCTELQVQKQETLDPEIQMDGAFSLKALTRKAVRDLESKIISKVLEANHWNRKRTAKTLKISYRGLLYKMREGDLRSSRKPLFATDKSDFWPQ